MGARKTTERGKREGRTLTYGMRTRACKPFPFYKTMGGARRDTSGRLEQQGCDRSGGIWQVVVR